ncbi:MAG TPA: hemerythrin domain-containing protein [Acidimicrobiales bacterium]
MAQNAISLLRSDHGNVEDLFRQFESAAPDAYQEKRRITDHVIVQLSRHAAIEEQVFYPALRGFPDLHDKVLESLEEHHATKLALSELEKLPANAERFDAKVKVMVENVRHHVREEEETIFPLVEQHVPFAELETMAAAMEEVRGRAPTRPHPFAPDQPPLNVLVGVPMAVLDAGIRVGLGAARMTGAALLQLTGLDRAHRQEAELQVRRRLEDERKSA